MLNLKKPRFLHISEIVKEYPELYRLTYDVDELALKLKHLALFYKADYRRWRFSKPRDSYFFRRDLIERIIKEFLH